MYHLFVVFIAVDLFCIRLTSAALVETAFEIRQINMCSVLTGGRLTTTGSNKSRNNPMEEMSEAESNPDSPPKMSPRKTEEENSQDREEELSVGSPGKIK